MCPFFKQPTFEVSGPVADAEVKQARSRAEKIAVWNWPIYFIAFLAAIQLGWKAGTEVFPMIAALSQNDGLSSVLYASFLSFLVGVAAAVLVMIPVSSWCRFWREAEINFQPIVADDAGKVRSLSLEHAEIDDWRAKIATVREITVGELRAMEKFDEDRKAQAERDRVEAKKAEALKEIYQTTPLGRRGEIMALNEAPIDDSPAGN